MSKVDHFKELIDSTNEPFLETVSDILFSNEENEQALLSVIKNLLSTSKTRLKGLKLLNKIITRCSPTALTENVFNWTSHCIVKFENDDLKVVKFDTLANILKLSKNIDNFNKKFLSEYMSDTLKACLSSQSPTEDLAALRCLTACVICFPPWFGNHKDKVETHLMRFLDTPSTNLAESAAVAFHYIQQAGGAGADCTNYTKNFSRQFKKICGSINRLFNSLIECIAEIDQDNWEGSGDDADYFSFAPFPPNFNQQKKMAITGIRLINCMTLMKTMLLKAFTGTKTVNVKQVLDVIKRTLGPHICLSQKEISIESYYLPMELINIQKHSMQLLRVLIIWGAADLIPFKHLITKMFMDMFRRINNCDCFSKNISFKENCHKSLNTWLLLSKDGHQSHNTYEHLITMLLRDATPDKRQVLLASSAGSSEKKSKKRQKVARNSEVNTNTQDAASERKPSHSDLLASEQSCILSLNTLNTILELTPDINQSLRKDLASFVTQALINERGTDFYNKKAQAALYKLLVSLHKQNNEVYLPSYKLSTNMFNKGLNSSDLSITRICFDGLELVEKIAQPVCQGFHKTIQSEEQNGGETKKYVESDELCNLLVDADENQSLEKYDCGNDIAEMTSKNAVHILENIVIQSATKIDKGPHNNVSGGRNSPTQSPVSKIAPDNVEAFSRTEEKSDSRTETESDGGAHLEMLELVLQTEETLDGNATKNVDTSEDYLITGSSGPSEESSVVEPPNKKKKIESDETKSLALEDMFSSFQNVVQE